MKTAHMGCTERITFILHHTRTAENVGGAARALANMGMSRLVLAEPAAWDRVQASRIAAEARELLEEAKVCERLEQAIDEATLVIATSARNRPSYPSLTPETAAARILEEARRGGAPALIFGDERSGLPRWAIDRAHGISTIPTHADFSSLNLAQAVLVHAYEIQRALPGSRKPEPASKAMPPEDLARLRKLTRALLLEAGYLNPDQPDRILGELERLLVRAGPTERDGQLLLALVRQLEWAVAKR